MAPNSNRRPTLRDVAGHAGVSFKTVSRVVNGEGGVSEDLASRVAEAVEALGYRPDDRARHLRQNGAHTGAIGFVMVDVANPFFSSILRGIEEVARVRDCLVLAGSTDGDIERQDQLIEAFVDRRVDGLIVVPSGESLGSLKREIERGTPVVFLDLEPTGVVADLVRSDHFGGAVAATEHLIAHGHRDIAFFGDHPSVFSAGQRLAGFTAAMEHAGLQIGEHRVLTGHLYPAAWRAAIREQLERFPLPSAIFTAQNFVTVGGVEALNDLGLRTQIAQIGFDDLELADVVEPGISVVPQRPWELGRRAAELLFRRLDGEAGAPIRDVLADAIVARGSGEIPPPPGS